MDRFVESQAIARHASFKSHVRASSRGTVGHDRSGSSRDFDKHLPQVDLYKDYTKKIDERKRLERAGSGGSGQNSGSLSAMLRADVRTPRTPDAASGDVSVSRSGTTRMLVDEAESTGSPGTPGLHGDQITPIPDFPSSADAAKVASEMREDDDDGSSLGEFPTPEPFKAEEEKKKKLHPIPAPVKVKPMKSASATATPAGFAESALSKVRGSQRDLLRSIFDKKVGGQTLERSNTFSGSTMAGGRHSRGNSNPFAKGGGETAPPKRRGIGSGVGHRKSHTDILTPLSGFDELRREDGEEFFGTSSHTPLIRSATSRDGYGDILHHERSKSRGESRREMRGMGNALRANEPSTAPATMGLGFDTREFIRYEIPAAMHHEDELEHEEDEVGDEEDRIREHSQGPPVRGESQRERELRKQLERMKGETAVLRREADMKDREIERFRHQTKATTKELREKKFEVDLLSKRLSMEEQQKEAALERARTQIASAAPKRLPQHKPHPTDMIRPMSTRSGAFGWQRPRIQTGDQSRSVGLLTRLGQGDEDSDFIVRHAFDRIKRKKEDGRFQLKAMDRPSEGVRTKLIFKSGGARKKLWSRSSGGPSTGHGTEMTGRGSGSAGAPGFGARKHTKTKQALERLRLHIKQAAIPLQTSVNSEEEKAVEKKDMSEAMAKENQDLKVKIAELKTQVESMKGLIEKEKKAAAAAVASIAAERRSVMPDAEKGSDTGIVPRKHKRRPSVLGIITPKFQDPQPSRPLKKWQWVPIADEYIAGTKWRRIGASASAKTFYSIEVEDFRVEIPKEIDDLFASNEPDLEMDELSDLSSDGAGGRGGKSGHKISRISTKRASAMKQVLKALKCSPTQLREAVITADGSKFGRQLLKALRSVTPLPEECNFVRHKVEHEGVSKSALKPEELFVFCMADLDQMELRVELWNQKVELEDKMVKAQKEAIALRDCLKAIESSENLPRILRIILEIGNYVNCDRKAPIGVYGFQLDSLTTLNRVRARDAPLRYTGAEYTLLSLVYQVCLEKYPKVLEIINEMDCCISAKDWESPLNGHNISALVGRLNSELNAFQKALREFRSKKPGMPISSVTAHSSSLSPDSFEKLMRAFYRTAESKCKGLDETWSECVTIGRKVGADYDFEYRTSDSFEELVIIFGTFVSDLKKEGQYFDKNWVSSSLRSGSSVLSKSPAILASTGSGSGSSKSTSSTPAALTSSLDPSILSAGAWQPSTDAVVGSSSASTSKAKKSVPLSSIADSGGGGGGSSVMSSGPEPLRELRNTGEMSDEHLQYLKVLAKSSELASQSSDADSVMREKRRRRSLSQGDIQIGVGFGLTEGLEIE